MNSSTSQFFSAAGGGVRDDRPQDKGATSPFLLENETVYRDWRKLKLATFMNDIKSAAQLVAIADPKALSDKEFATLTERCRHHNFVFYRIAPCDDKLILKQLWGQLGLYNLVTNPCADKEKISSIEVTPGTRYIPYTARRLKWHTDGYYNAASETICAFAMHCVIPAIEGGENQYFDPEILYILLRDENPDYVAALMHPKTLTVPQNSEEISFKGTLNARIAPVLALDPRSGDLIVRYTERDHYIIWRKDSITAAARAFIQEVLQTPSKYRITHRLKAGEGVICNNVLHNRAQFTDAAPGTERQRLLYRARYHDRVVGTGCAALLPS